MPIQQQPLFRLDALRAKLDAIRMTPALEAKQRVLSKWRDFTTTEATALRHRGGIVEGPQPIVTSSHCLCADPIPK